MTKLIYWLGVLVIFAKKSLKKRNIDIKTLFCLIILFSNTLFLVYKAMVGKFDWFGNVKYQKILFYAIDYKYSNCPYL